MAIPQVIYFLIPSIINISFCHIYNYNIRLDSLSLLEESTSTEVSASKDTTVDTPSLTNANTSQVSKTAILIINLERRWLPDLMVTQRVIKL